MSTDPFTQVSESLLGVLQSDQELSSLVRRMNHYAADDAVGRKIEWLPADLPVIQLDSPIERTQVIRSSRASRFHLKYPISVWVSRSQLNPSGQMNLLRWRVLMLLLRAGPDLGLAHVVRVSPGQWVTGPVQRKSNQKQSAASGMWCEQLNVEVDLWVSHRQENTLI